MGSEREDGRRHMKEKIKSDLADLWVCGGGKFGWGGKKKSTGTVRGRKLIPPRCCARVAGGMPDQPTGTADIMLPPT